MNGKDLTPEKAVNIWYPLCERLSRGDPDLLQELLITLLDLPKYDRINDAFVVAVLKTRRKMYWRGYLWADRYGSSVDNGAKTRRKDVTIQHYDAAEEFSGKTFRKEEIIEWELRQIMWDAPNPEKVALFKVSYAHFIHSLNPKERGYVEARLEELDWEQIERLRIANRNEQAALKKHIRRKFERCFS